MAQGSKLTWLTSLRGADLTHGEFRVLTILGTYSSGDGTNAHPGISRLAADCVMTERHVQRVLRALVGKGAIRETALGGNAVRKGWASVYAVNLKGDIRDSKGDIPDSKGDIRDEEAASNVTPSGPYIRSCRSGPIDQTLSSGEGPSPATALDADDFAPIREWLEAQLGDFDSFEESIALGMWGNGSNRIAILNKISKDRRGDGIVIGDDSERRNSAWPM